MDYKNELRLSIEDKFGKSIQTKTDSQLLRIHIFEEIKVYISESTLRRFFNLIPNGEPTLNTLDLLSSYIGFSNYEQFKENCTRNLLKTISFTSDEFIISQVNKKRGLTILDINLLANRIIQLIKDGHIDSCKLYFNSYDLKVLLSNNINNLNLFALLIGPFIEDPKLIANPEDLLETDYFKELILYNYVDLQNDALEHYYHSIIKANPASIDMTFVCSVIALNFIYKQELDLAKSYYEKIDSTQPNISPVLAGRIALLNWIFSKNQEKLIEEANAHIDQIAHFSIDILHYFIIVENLSMLRVWLFHFPRLIEIKNWFNRDLITLLKIVDLLVQGQKQLVVKLVNEEMPFRKTSTMSKIIEIIKR